MASAASPSIKTAQNDAFHEKTLPSLFPPPPQCLNALGRQCKVISFAYEGSSPGAKGFTREASFSLGIAGRTYAHTHTHLSIFAVRAVPAVFSRGCLVVGVCLDIHASLLLVVRASICFVVAATCCCFVSPNASAFPLVELELLVLVLVLLVWLLPVFFVAVDPRSVLLRGWRYRSYSCPVAASSCASVAASCCCCSEVLVAGVCGGRGARAGAERVSKLKQARSAGGLQGASRQELCNGLLYRVSVDSQQ